MQNELLKIESDNHLPDSPQAGELGVVAREQAEVQAAVFSAKKFPRNEAQSYAKAIKSFQRPQMAERSTYSFPRGGKAVSGPSVDCARELARCWGNIQSGLRIVSVDEDIVHIKGFAIDLETNTKVEHEDRFEKLVQRKNGQGKTIWVKPDERDLRELVNRRGAILVRNSILQLVPPDVIESVVNEAKTTLKKHASGKLGKNREDTIRELIKAFEGFNISVQLLEEKLGHGLSLLSDEEYVELRGIFKSLNDGHTKRADHFNLASMGAATAETDDLNAALGVSK